MPELDNPSPITSNPVLAVKFNRNLMLVGLGGVVVGLIIGILIGRMFQNQPQSTNLTPSGITVNQTGVVQGKLVKVSGSVLSIQDESGQNVDVSVGANISIYVYKDRANPPVASSDLSALVIGRDVRVNLVMQGSQFVATTITVLPNPNASVSPSASASSSAARKNP